MRSLFTFIGILSVFIGYAQHNETKDTLIFGDDVKQGLRLSSTGEQISARRARELFKLNPEADHYFRKARVNSGFALFISTVGGGCLGAGIASAISNRRGTWPLIAIGGGLLGISVPFGFAAGRNFHKAVKAYNSSN